MDSSDNQAGYCGRQRRGQHQRFKRIAGDVEQLLRGDGCIGDTYFSKGGEMAQTIVGIILIFFGIATIYLDNNIKEKTAILESLELGSPRVVIVDKNKIRWEYDNGSGFEITLTKLK